jgi:predicted ATPase
MTKAPLEAGSDDAARQAAAIPLATLGIPATLHASLMARLDRLGPAKEAAQVGAAIGREFSHALIARRALARTKGFRASATARSSGGFSAIPRAEAHTALVVGLSIERGDSVLVAAA